jgi:ABC-2 type transport system permease protein
MSTMEITTSTARQEAHLHRAKPSFVGLVGGELFKIRHQLSSWIMLIVLVCLTFAPYLVALGLDGVANDLNQSPDNFLGTWLGENMLVLRAASGFILIIMTARLIGQEYNLGTIRILLARGVGRVQLLLAKLAAMAIWAIFIILISLVLNLLLTGALVLIKTGSLHAFSGMTSTTWHDLAIYVGTVAISMGASILMASTLSVLGRSMAFGMSLSLVWFPLDNIMVGVLVLVSDLTRNTAWLNFSAYLLGPNLNSMFIAITGQPWAFGAGVASTDPVGGTHTVIVTVVYAAIFALVSIGLTWKRDVKE